MGRKPERAPLTREEMILIASDIARNDEVGPTARLTALRQVQALQIEAAEEELALHGKNGRGPRVAVAREPESSFEALEAETEMVAPEAAVSYRVRAV